MELDINKIMADFLAKNQKCSDANYKQAYCDGVLDFFNEIKSKDQKIPEKIH